MNNTFYFIAYVNNRTALTVIDLGYNVDYQMDDWDVAIPIRFNDHIGAIKVGRSVAKANDLQYVLFESRYNKELNEYLGVPCD